MFYCTICLNSEDCSKKGRDWHPTCTPCGHVFHNYCLFRWFYVRKTILMEEEVNVDVFLSDDAKCPTCNSDFMEYDVTRVFLSNPDLVTVATQTDPLKPDRIGKDPSGPNIRPTTSNNISHLFLVAPQQPSSLDNWETVRLAEIRNQGKMLALMESNLMWAEYKGEYLKQNTAPTRLDPDLRPRIRVGKKERFWTRLFKLFVL